MVNPAAPDPMTAIRCGAIMLFCSIKHPPLWMELDSGISRERSMPDVGLLLLENCFG